VPPQTVFGGYFIVPEELDKYYQLFSSKYDEVLAFALFVIARFCKDSETIHNDSGQRENVVAKIKNDLPLVLRYYAFHKNKTVCEFARIALNEIGDEDFKKIESYDAWMKTLGLPTSIANELKKEDIEMRYFFDLAIELDSLERALFNQKMKTGHALLLLSSIKTIRTEFDEATKLIARLTRKYTAEDSAASAIAPKTSDNNEPTWDVFVSYCWANKSLVAQLKDVLEREGLRCWMDDHKMQGGDELFTEIDKGITNSSIVIACLSNQYSASVNCTREINLASDRKKMILPVWVGPCDLWPPRGAMGPLLSGKLYIDLCTKDKFSQCVTNLVTAIKQSAGKA